MANDKSILNFDLSDSESTNDLAENFARMRQFISKPREHCQEVTFVMPRWYLEEHYDTLENYVFPLKVVKNGY